MEEQRRDLALIALSLLHGDAEAGDVAPEPLELAEGEAYLNGFIVQMLADAMHITVPEALERIRRALGGGDESGDREPRRPDPRPPVLAAERDLEETQ